MEAGPQQGITRQEPGVPMLIMWITLQAVEAALDVTLVPVSMPQVAMAPAPLATIVEIGLCVPFSNKGSFVCLEKFGVYVGVSSCFVAVVRIVFLSLITE
ncbi:hypothetical protein SLEP1_g35206 [Rubroshorea leprosula]|uniref:Uncharacterized protein n=1 Tax=Rubroshorea leprosula TaxID=152421 RepID=A0AAV5KMY0_9ROSI|nr:hypothetical protein SLEP1_g35206 [Rubroshorea leprosula]